MLKGMTTRALPLGNDFTLTDETEQVIDVTECMITTEKEHTDELNDTCEVGHVEWQYMKSYVGTAKTEWDVYKSTFKDSRKELFKMLEEKQAFVGVNVPMEDQQNPSRCCQICKGVKDKFYALECYHVLCEECATRIFYGDDDD